MKIAAVPRPSGPEARYIMRFSWNAKQKRTFQFCETKIAKQLFTFALFAKLNQASRDAARDDIDTDRKVHGFDHGL